MLKKEMRETQMDNPCRRRACGGGRSRSVDVAKGIGIILMVCGHARAPFNHFVSLFHMALFFIISGYLYNKRNAENLKQVGTYTVKKVKTLWVPYVVFNAVFIILNNVFINIGIYTTDPKFLQIVSGNRNEIMHIYGFKELITELLKSVFLLDNMQLGGALWFLRTLLIITVFHNVLMWITKKLKFQNVIQIVVLIICCVFALLMNSIDVFMPNWEESKIALISIKAGRQLFAPYLAYYLGILCKRIDFNDYIQKNRFVSVIIPMIILVVLNRFGSVDLSMGIITGLLFFLTVSLAGYTLIMSISYLIDSLKLMAKPLEYLGKHTMCIIGLHLISFKLVSYIYLMFAGQDLILLASFPVLDEANKFLWVFYSVVGIIIPIICYQFYKGILNKA